MRLAIVAALSVTCSVTGLTACAGSKPAPSRSTTTSATSESTKGSSATAQSTPPPTGKLVFSAIPSKPIVETPPLNLPPNPSSTVGGKLHYNRPASDPYPYVCPPKKPEDGSKCLRATAAKDGGCRYPDAACGCEHGPPADAEVEGKWKCAPQAT